MALLAAPPPEHGGWNEISLGKLRALPAYGRQLFSPRCQHCEKKKRLVHYKKLPKELPSTFLSCDTCDTL